MSRRYVCAPRLASSDVTNQQPSGSIHSAIAERIIGNQLNASQPAVSPDGHWVAFVVTRVDLPKNRYVSQVWLAAADGATPPRVVSSGTNDGKPTFSPDGTLLAFTGRRDAKKSATTLHVLPVGAPGELRTIATMPDGLDSPLFSPDGRWIAFTSRTQDERYRVEGAEDGDTSWQAPRRIERFFTSLNGEGWVFDRPSHVHVVPVDGTGAPRNLTPGPHQHSGISWLTDSSAVITSAQRHDTWDTDLASDLYLVPLDGDIRRLTDGTAALWEPSVSPDGSRIAMLGNPDPHTEPQNVRVGVVATDRELQQPEWLSLGLDRTFAPTAGVQAPVWLDDSRLLASAEDAGETHLYVLMDHGIAPSHLTTGKITVKSFAARGGGIVWCASAVDEATDVYSLHDGVPVRLTDFASRYSDAVHPLGWERFRVPCADGTDEIDAWIMRPADFDPSRRYPVLLNVHGGPHTQYGETLFDEAQMQAAAGFVVLMSNPRGSSGRAESWGQAIIGPRHPRRPGSGWGGLDVDDVMSVLDTTLERYTFCDPARVGMLGGSYGGYMATMLAGRFGHRFRAVCSERSVNNLVTEEFTADIGSSFHTEMGADHIDGADYYMSMSPIRYVREISCPMLLIHSENDLRCPISQAEELFTAMRLLGKEVVFYRFPGEDHELSRSGSPVHRRQRAEIILDYFAHHLA